MLRLEIAHGELKAGERTPSIRQLADRFEVAPGTVQSALRELRNEGLIVSQQARGTFVRTDVVDVSPESQDPQVKADFARMDELAQQLVELRAGDLRNPARLLQLAKVSGDLAAHSARLAALAAIARQSQPVDK